MKRYKGMLVVFAVVMLLAACEAGTVSADPSPSGAIVTIAPNIVPSATDTTDSTPAPTLTMITPTPTEATPSFPPYPTDRPTTLLPAPGGVGAHDGISLQVTGRCADGPLRLAGTGFTPNGPYLTQVWYPNGQRYLNWQDKYREGGLGYADYNGESRNWSWDCNAGGIQDPAGVYVLLMTDLSTGRWAYTTFQVTQP